MIISKQSGAAVRMGTGSLESYDHLGCPCRTEQGLQSRHKTSMQVQSLRKKETSRGWRPTPKGLRPQFPPRPGGWTKSQKSSKREQGGLQYRPLVQGSRWLVMHYYISTNKSQMNGRSESSLLELYMQNRSSESNSTRHPCKSTPQTYLSTTSHHLAQTKMRNSDSKGMNSTP